MSLAVTSASFVRPMHAHSTAQQRTFLEFFAGIGLVHAALRPLGWECHYANDIDVKKKRMYESYFGPMPYYHVEDIWKTNEVADRITVRADLATASFPCVDLSLAGNRKGFRGIESGAFYGFIRVLNLLKRRGLAPKAILVENVVGFLSSHEGADFQSALGRLCALDYLFDAFIVDAKYFVPQSRPRLFIIAVDHSTASSCPRDTVLGSTVVASDRFRPAKLLASLNSKEVTENWRPLPLPPLPAEQRYLPEFIDLDGSQEWWPDKIIKKHLNEMHSDHLSRINKLRRLPSLSVGTIYRRVRQGSSRSEIRTDGLAGCLRTPRGGSSKQIVFVVGDGQIRMRWMNATEYARLQGAPDFPIEVPRNEALFGFGDAVCVPVVTWIGRNVLSQLFSTSNQTLQAVL